MTLFVMQEGLSSLMLAIFAEYEETVETLLNANADPNITENISNEWKVVAKLFCCY